MQQMLRRLPTLTIPSCPTPTRPVPALLGHCYKQSYGTDAGGSGCEGSIAVLLRRPPPPRYNARVKAVTGLL